MIISADNTAIGGGGAKDYLVANYYGYNSITESTLTIDIPTSGTLKLMVTDYYCTCSLTINGTTITKTNNTAYEHSGTNYWEISVQKGDVVILTKGTSATLFTVMGVVSA